MIKFSDFMKVSQTSSSTTSKPNSLNEAKIVSSKNQFWPKLSIDDFLKIAEYSSQWNSKSDVGTFKFKATENQLEDLQTAIDQEKTFLEVTGGGWILELSWKKPKKTSTLLFRIPSESALGFDETAAKLVKDLASDDFKVTYDKVEKPLLVKDPSTGKKVPDPSGKKILIQALLKAEGSQSKIEDLKSTLEKANVPKAVLNVKHFDSNQLVDGQLFGDFPQLQKFLPMVNGDENDFEFKQDLDDETKWIVQCAYKSIYNPKNTSDPHAQSIDEFCKFLTKKNVALAIRKFHILRNAELKTLANKQEAKKKEFFKDKELDAAGNPVYDQNELKAALATVEVDVKSKWKIGKTLLEVPDLTSLLSLVGMEKDEEEKDDLKNDDVKKKAKLDIVDKIEFSSDPGGRCAERRMKLFAAAQKRGAKVIKTASYVMAVCQNANQVAPFGRLKPKVKPGTNEIDPDCNLEDWEGITPENKAKRDNKTSKYETIRDGIDDGYGHSFDRLTGESGQSMNGVQFAESAWCVCGSTTGTFNWDYTGSQSNFNNYTEDGKRPLVVFMSVKRGALYLYAKFLKNGTILENILNENEKCDGDAPKSSNPSDSKQQQFCKDFEMADPEFKKAKNYIEKVYYPDFDPNIDEEDPVFDKGTAGGRCAERRMKLFAAAEHYGAKIIKTASWVAAVCTSGAQCHQFARLKPIVKPGTNEIDPDCNLEDWEGITPENKAKRDDYNNGDRIKDGIDDGHGKSFDRLKKVSSQSPTVKYAESAWCVSGACSNEFKWNDASVYYFDSYSDNGKYPIVVFMSTKRGAMYMYSNKNGNQQFDNESDCIDGSNQGNPDQSYQVQFLNKMKTIDKDFDSMHSKIVSTYFTNTGSGNSSSMSKDEILKLAKSEGDLKSNGWLRIRGREWAKKYQPLYGDVAGLVVPVNNASEMFRELDLTQVKNIDFCNIVSCADMTFSRANIGDIKILNSGKLKTAQRMFLEAILEDLEQLDTASLEIADSMFEYVVPSKGGALRLPAFNLQHCRSIQNMFKGTNIQKVVIQNVQNVEKAKGLYFSCYALATYPETKFPKIGDLKELTKDGSEQAAMMFPGCTILQSKKMRQRLNNNPSMDFNAMVKDTEEWYAEKQKADPKIVDDRGFLRVKSAQTLTDFKDTLKQYPGIVIEFENAESLFANKVVNLKILDLSHVKYARKMFSGAQIDQLQDIVGTETIVDATEMFCGCDSKALPDMVFEKLDSCKNMLKNCDHLKVIPEIVIKGGIKVLTNLSFNYLFCDQSTIPSMLKAVGGIARIEDWIKEQKSNSKDILNFFTFHKDTKLVEVADHEIAKLVLNNWQILKNAGAEGIYVATSDASSLFEKITGFYGDKVIEEFPLVDGTEVTNASHMFYSNQVKKFVGLQNFNNLQFANGMFSYLKVLNGGIPEMDFSKIVDGREMFYNTKSKEPLKTFDFPSLVNGDRMFLCSQVLPNGFDLAKIKIPKAEYISNMFQNISSVDGNNNDHFKLSDVEYPNVLKSPEAFSQSNLVEVGDVSIPKSTDIHSMFSQNHLATVKGLHAPKATYAKFLFSYCHELETIGVIDLPSVQKMSWAFHKTENLKKILIPRFNPSGNIDATNAFKLSNLAKVFGVNMDKWKAVASLFAMMTV